MVAIAPYLLKRLPLTQVANCSIYYIGNKDMVAFLAIPMIWIVGGLDPFFKDHNILSKRTFIIAKVGHYLFLKIQRIFIKL